MDIQQLKERAQYYSDRDAQLLLGKCYFTGHGVPQDYKEALKWFLACAQYATGEAAYLAGVCYENGFGTPKDLSEAIRWYCLAEYPEADFAMGLFYEDGIGVEQSYFHAALSYEMAAKKGHAKAQFNLALLYERGVAVPGGGVDIAKAVYWYRLSYQNGCEDARTALRRLGY